MCCGLTGLSTAVKRNNPSSPLPSSFYLKLSLDIFFASFRFAYSVIYINISYII